MSSLIWMYGFAWAILPALTSGVLRAKELEDVARERDILVYFDYAKIRLHHFRNHSNYSTKHPVKSSM